MPLKIPTGLPARETLEQERVTLIDGECELRIAIVNIMPTKQETEIQHLRLIGNSAFSIEVTFIYMESHISKNTPQEYLMQFYQSFRQVKDQTFDGLIITGAPVEQLEFTDVTYWDELRQIMDWSLTHVRSTLHICWGAQAALYHHYQIPKYPLDKKVFGIFPHTVNKQFSPIVRGFDDIYDAPHSRHTEIRREDMKTVADLDIVSESEEAGVYLVTNEKKRQIFVTGHSEYSKGTLKTEYQRDLEKGMDMDIPKNYFFMDDPSCEPIVKWRAHSVLLFSNWIDFYVCEGVQKREKKQSL